MAIKYYYVTRKTLIATFVLLSSHLLQHPEGRPRKSAFRLKIGVAVAHIEFTSNRYRDHFRIESVRSDFASIIDSIVDSINHCSPGGRVARANFKLRAHIDTCAEDPGRWRWRWRRRRELFAIVRYCSFVFLRARRSATRSAAREVSLYVISRGDREARFSFETSDPRRRVDWRRKSATHGAFRREGRSEGGKRTFAWRTERVPAGGVWNQVAIRIPFRFRDSRAITMRAMRDSFGLLRSSRLLQ